MCVACQPENEVFVFVTAIVVGMIYGAMDARGLRAALPYRMGQS